MNILDELATARGERSENANRSAAEKCLKNPKLLDEIASGFNSKDKKLISDCAEVMTMTAEHKSELIMPYAEQLINLLKSKETRTRWEAAHSLAYIAEKIPELITVNLSFINGIITGDKSIIVRDYLLDAMGNYAKYDKSSAENAYAVMKNAIDTWGDRHGKQIVLGLGNIYEKSPEYKVEIIKLVSPILESSKKVNVKEAQKLLKKIDK